MYETGENGGAMVYKRGVGVTRVQEVPVTSSPAPDSTQPDTATTPQSAPRIETP
jgi:hypothetical protein